MERCMKVGLNTLRSLLESIKGCIIKFISKLSKEVMDGSLNSALTSSFEDDNTWVIDSGAARHMTGERGELKTL